MKRALLLSFAVILVLGAALTGCAPAAPTAAPAAEPTAAPAEEPTAAPAEEPTAAPAEKQVVVVGTDATWPPFEMVNEQTKELEGFDIDLMNAIAEEAGFEIEWVNVGFDPLLAGMATGQYDVAISVITITDERKDNMLFSDPYYDAGQLVAVRVDSTDINGPDDLPGKTAGAQIGTTGAIEISKIEGAELKTYDDVGQAFMDLINGQVDAVVADSPLVYEYVGKNADKIKAVGEPFTDEFYGIAVKKGAEDLLAQINEALKTVMDQGLIEELNDKWVKAAE